MIAANPDAFAPDFTASTLEEALQVSKDENLTLKCFDCGYRR